MDIEYTEIEGRLPDKEEALNSVYSADKALEETAENVQEEAKEQMGVALNGAQTASLLSIISQYKNGVLAPEEAVSIISISIGISEEKARKLLHIA